MRNPDQRGGSERAQRRRGLAAFPRGPAAFSPRIRADRSTASAPFPRTFTPIAAPLRRRSPRIRANCFQRWSRSPRIHADAAPLRRRPPAHSRQSLPPLRRRPPAHSRRSQHRFGAAPRAFAPIAAPLRRRPPAIHANRFHGCAVSPAIASAGLLYLCKPAPSKDGGGFPRHGRGACRGTGAGRRSAAAVQALQGTTTPALSKPSRVCAARPRRRSPAPSMPEAPFPRLRRAVTPRRIPRGTRRSPSPCRSRGPRASGG